MDHPIRFGLLDATARQQVQFAEQLVDSAWNSLRPKFIELVRSFLSQPLSPSAFFAFEMALLALAREFGRVLLERTINALEPQSAELLPHDLWFQCGGYRRRNGKTRNSHVATRLGSVILWRRGYRSWDAGESSIFPAVVRYDEIHRGMVQHAMRVTVRRSRRAYVHPATHYASRLTDENCRGWASG